MVKKFYLCITIKEKGQNYGKKIRIIYAVAGN